MRNVAINSRLFCWFLEVLPNETKKINRLELHEPCGDIFCALASIKIALGGVEVVVLPTLGGSFSILFYLGLPSLIK